MARQRSVAEWVALVAIYVPVHVAILTAVLSLDALTGAWVFVLFAASAVVACLIATTVLGLFRAVRLRT